MCVFVSGMLVLCLSVVCPAVGEYKAHFSQLVSGVRKRQRPDCQQNHDSIVSSDHEEEESDHDRDPDFLPSKMKRT